MTDNQLQHQILAAVTRIEARQTSTENALMRIERKQDTLIAALAEPGGDMLDSQPLEPSDPK